MSNHTQQPQSAVALSDEQKEAYLTTLLSVLVPFDSRDQERLRRVYQILAVMKVGPATRKAFVQRLFLTDTPPEPSLDVLVEEGGPQDSIGELRGSLGKDIIALEGNEATLPADVARRAQALLQRLGLTAAHIDALRAWIEWENGLLEKIGRGDLKVTASDMPVELFKRATAVGLPLGALYFSGSIVGLSAAGITGGLAAIGSAAPFLIGLGLNPMTAGIVALIVVGITVKALLDALLPRMIGEDREALRQAALELAVRRERYLCYLEHDADSIVRASWWERLTGRAERRATSAQQLRALVQRDQAEAASTSST